MEHVDTLVIGFGKAGKTLAGALAKRGQKVALVERSPQMYGGTCINIACIPTKALEFKSRHPHATGKTESDYAAAIAAKRELTTMLRGKNYAKIAGTGAEIIDGTAAFLSPDVVRVTCADGIIRDITAERIVINTGATSRVGKIAGLEQSKRLYTSSSIMELDTLPKELVIVGASYIALEFASIYANFGAHVTVLQRGTTFLPKADQEIAAQIKADFAARGIRVLEQAQIRSGHEDAEGLTLTLDVAGQTEQLKADAVLFAIGRRPNTDELNLAQAGVELDEQGAIKVTNRLQSTNPKVWAAGDVKGGEQFTYISLDDFRILLSQFVGDGTRTTDNRGLIPHTVFIDPPYASIGMTEEAARAEGLAIRVSHLPVAGVPKAHILETPRGLLKLILEEESERILGAHFYSPEAHEIIHIVEVAMVAGLSFKVLRNMIFAHPTMAEALNDL